MIRGRHPAATLTAAVRTLLWLRTAEGLTRRSFHSSRIAMVATVVPPQMAMVAPVIPLATKYTLVCNNERVACDLCSEGLLKTYPRGPYTTGRTHHRNSIFEFDFHNSRIAESTSLMVAAGSLARPTDFARLTDPATLRPEFLATLRTAVKHFGEEHSEGEMKVTTLLNVDESSGKHQLLVHVQPLGIRPDLPVKVQILGHPRENAAAKDSLWITAREGLWEGREANTHEVILMDDDGRLMEGLSSNFYAITHAKDSKPAVLYTAKEGVLLGTVRDLALKLCPGQGIEVVEHPPNIKDMASYDEVFISSTSRWVLPVGEVVLPDKTQWLPKSTEVTTALYRDLLGHVLENSTPVLD